MRLGRAHSILYSADPPSLLGENSRANVERLNVEHVGNFDFAVVWMSRHTLHKKRQRNRHRHVRSRLSC